MHLDERERGDWKGWLKTQHSKTKIMASSPSTSWQIDGKTMGTVTNFIFLGFKITADVDCHHEIKRLLIRSEGDQPWDFFGRNDAKAETPVRWPPDVKNWFTGKDPDAGKDWRQEKGTTEDEMVSWHHQLNGHEFAQAPGDGEGQGSLGCCSPWGCKESDMTEWLNNNSQVKAWPSLALPSLTICANNI